MLRICAFAPPPPGPVEESRRLLSLKPTPVKRSGIEPELTIAPKLFFSTPQK
jgi:hypothetical protein